MKKLIKYLPVIITVLLSYASSLSAAELSVEIKGIEQSKGMIRIGLYNNPDIFPKKGKAYKFDSVKVSKIDETIVMTFKNIPEGIYAAAIYHDTNSNNRLDTNWIGIPKEGVGFSNDVTGFMGSPSFEDAKFVITKKNKTIIITMKY